MSEINIQGFLPPIPTPFDEHEGLAPEKLWANIQRWNTCGFSGYVILGSNGEFVHLTERERLNVLEVARDAIPQHLLFVAGCSLQSTADTIIYLKQAARLGANVALVNTPFYFKNAITQECLLSYFRRVADESPIPILLYNVPVFTGVTLSPQTVAKLAEHPNIVGMKDSSGDIIALSNTLRLTPTTFRVLTGSAPTLFPALSLGAHGAVLAVSSIAWEACLEIQQAVQSQEYHRARDIQLRLLPVAAAVSSISGLKAALPLRGFYAGPPRSPLLPASEETRSEILKTLRASGLLPELE